MMDYQEALWTWFLRRTSKDDTYGFAPLTETERTHLLRCGMDGDKSNAPEVGTVDTWGGTFEGTARIGAIYTDHWICKCGEYGTGYRAKQRMPLLAITGDYAIGDVIREVIETGAESTKKGGKRR